MNEEQIRDGVRVLFEAAARNDDVGGLPALAALVADALINLNRIADALGKIAERPA